METNLKAFLDTIATSEGTIGKGDDGYNVLVGGALFHNNYVDHPRIKVPFPKLGISSTAAGRYQLLARYYDAYKHLLGLTDFSPDSQDKIAIQQIKECKALDDINNGEFATAIQKCAHIWASLPGSGYNQHENKLEFLQAAYEKAGGTINA